MKGIIALHGYKTKKPYGVAKSYSVKKKKIIRKCLECGKIITYAHKLQLRCGRRGQIGTCNNNHRIRVTSQWHKKVGYDTKESRIKRGVYNTMASNLSPNRKKTIKKYYEIHREKILEYQRNKYKLNK